MPTISPYDLRHSRLTLWANTPGVALPAVSYLAGHKSIATTARYVQGQRDAARALVLRDGAELGGLLGGLGSGASVPALAGSPNQPKTGSAKEGT